MISVVLQLLKSKLAAYAAILVIILVLGIGGPMYFSQWKWEFRGAALLVLIVFLIYLAIKTYRERKKARMLEGFLQQQADDQVLAAQPDVQDELAAIKKKLNEAIGVLKHSRLARGRRGSQALYVLPWYMIIGPSAAGKSTMLRNSGLQFPSVDSTTDEPARVKGLGGTRNCDWWLSSQGIFLDTAGRYTVSAEGGGGDDREEWSNFLAMLKKARGRAPINGLVLAVAIDEILREDDDGLEQLAKTLRRRIDELIVKLEILFPIYVVFTKCDLIAGFTEYCGDFRRREREQVWGYTRRYEQSKRPLHEEFSREIAGLTTVLEHRRLRQLQAAVRPVQKRGTYLFPVEFGAAARRLTRFVEILFQPNPYQQNPMVRGFYFNSGTQEGTPIAQVMAAMRRDFGLASDAPLPIEPVRETKAFFIKDLFQQVILPDESRVMPLTSAGRKRGWIRLAWNLCQATVAALLILAFLSSYFKNGVFNDGLEKTTTIVAATLSSAPPFSVEAQRSLDELRVRLEIAEQGPGFMRSWGLYSGGVVIDSARQVYFRRYQRLFLEPLAESLGQRLLDPPQEDAPEEEAERYFDIYTSYKMLTAPYDSVANDTTVLKREAGAIAERLMDPEDLAQFKRYLRRQIPYYWKHRVNEQSSVEIPSLRAQGDPRVLQIAEQWAEGYWDYERLYRLVIRGADNQLGMRGRREAAGGTTRLTVQEIGAAYTREGWEANVEARIKNMPDEIKGNPAMKIAFQGQEDDRIRRELTRRYVRRFLFEWRKFIDSAKVRGFDNLLAATSAVEEFSSGGNSPMLVFLDWAYDQGNIDPKGDTDHEIRDAFLPLGTFLGKGAPQQEGAPPVPRDQYATLLGSLPNSIDGVRTKLEDEAHCAQTVKTLNATLRDTKQGVEALIDYFASDIAKATSKFLVKPLDAARGAAYGELCNCLNSQWETRVYEKFSEELISVYPFNRQSDIEAGVTDVVKFFGTGGILEFDKNEVADARDLGVSMSGRYETAVQVARRIRGIMPGSHVQIAIELTADARYMSGLRSKRFTYGNEVFASTPGQQELKNFVWKGSERAAWVEVEPIANVYTDRISASGAWSMLRLFDKATFADDGTCSWPFSAGSGTGPTYYAKYGLSGSGAWFLRQRHFSQFRCPSQICGR